MSAGLTPSTPTPKPGIINGPVLDAAHWTATVKNFDPSLHRLQNAFGLTIGLFVGRHTMNLLTGETPSGEKIEKKDVPFVLRPLHGVMAYNHFSDDPHDRWRKVVDLWTPAIAGATGAIAGTYNFAMAEVHGMHPYTIAQQFKHNPAAATIEKAETAALFTQSHPWRLLSGATSMFGSSSGFQLMPGINNYGATLGSSFAMSISRNKLSTPYAPKLAEFMTGNTHFYPYGPAPMLGHITTYLMNNPDKDPVQTRAQANAILEPWFGKQVTPEHTEKFVQKLYEVRNKFYKEGGIPQAAKPEFNKQMHEILSGVGLEKTLREVGLNPKHASIGRNGFWEYIARRMGYGGKLDAIEQQYKQAVTKRFGNGDKPLIGEAARAFTHPGDRPLLMKGNALVMLGALGVGAISLNARHWHQKDNEELIRVKRNLALQNGDESALEEAVDLLDDHKTASGKKSFTEVLNDKPLKYMEWMGDAFNSPETLGMHRLSCALGLTGGGMVGLKLMEALTGRTFTGGSVPIEKVPEMLRPLYKKFSYNPHSDHPKDRWGYVFHLALPAVFATAGVIGASNFFFRNRKHAVDKAEFIDDYENKMTMEEARPWTLLTATSTILNTPSGSIFLPIPGINYGMSLGTRFTLSSGRKMIFPGIGEWWTGNASRYPLGPSALRDYMIKYAVGNPSQHPDQLEEMAIGILRPWFKDITGEQIMAFVHKVEQDRDKFLAEGGVPEESKRNLEKMLIQHFKGAGLEQTLREIGLDPLKATLGNNGFSAQIAKFLGETKELNKIHDEFAHKYTDRILHEKQQKAEGAGQHHAV